MAHRTKNRAGSLISLGFKGATRGLTEEEKRLKRKLEAERRRQQRLRGKKRR